MTLSSGFCCSTVFVSGVASGIQKQLAGVSGGKSGGEEPVLGPLAQPLPFQQRLPGVQTFKEMRREERDEEEEEKEEEEEYTLWPRALPKALTPFTFMQE